MKYRIYALALLLLHTCAHAKNVFGKSVFVDNPGYELYGTTGYALPVHLEHEKGHIIEKPELSLSIFGGKTTQGGQDDLRKYFLFENKTALTVREDIPDDLGEDLSQDLLCRDFNVSTVGELHSSEITMDPKQTRLGFMISYRHSINEKYWVNFDAPFEHLKQTVGLSETVIVAQSADDQRERGNLRFYETGTTTLVGHAQTNMFNAFRQPGLKYGRIDGVNKKDGMADFKIRLGRNAIVRDDLLVSQYIGIIIPTGNRRTAKDMWEAIIGNGHHVGIGWGSTTQICVHEASRCNWWVTNVMSGHYLFENTQKRSLDLYNGPWTRYLAMFEDAAGRTNNRRTFGINLMTRDVKVNPGVALGMSTQISLVGKNWNLNAGIINNFRQAEEVRLAQAWELGPMIADLTVAPGSEGEVFPLRKMGRNLDIANITSASDIFIKESDINLNSAAHPTVFSSTIHASIAYFNDGEYSQNYEFGASMDISQQNTAISRWNMYGRLLISF